MRTFKAYERVSRDLNRSYRGSRIRATAPRMRRPLSCRAAAVPVTGTGEPQ